MTTVQRLVGDASLVEAVYEGTNPSSTCATFCTLKLRRTASSTDPTIISSDANGIYLKEGTSPTSTLTTNKVLINHFRLTKQEIPGGHAIVEISTSFSYNTNNPAFAVTRAIESAIARVNAATFDADLLPNQDNTFDIGQVSGSNLRWKSGRFSGDVTVGGNVGIGTTNPVSSAILELSATNRAFLLPRLTTAQRDVISSPAAGLLLYNSTANALNIYNGSSWGAVGGTGGATVATTVSGCGTASAGAVCLLRIGSSPYEFVTLTYDTTYGKWVSQPTKLFGSDITGANGNVASGQGYLNWSSGGDQTIEIGSWAIDWKKYLDAGLSLQLKQVGRSQITNASYSFDVWFNGTHLSDGATDQVNFATGSPGCGGSPIFCHSLHQSTANLWGGKI
ncbi:MAG: hypothetical protein AAB737_00655, partial [Patescibacteria group bacterium]